MATLAQPMAGQPVGDERFFLRAAILMTILVVAGFSFQLAMGRSTFASPLRVHAHAILFMGWVFIYLMQNILVATGRMRWHRRLGWVAAVWIVPMVASAFVVIVHMARNGTTAFFFQPLKFLIFDPVTLIGFAGLTVAAILLRRRTEWHRRLHFCAMALLLGPAFGRLLPLPLLIPWAWEATFFASLLFPIAGVIADLRRRGAVHPAWKWGIGTTLAVFVVTQAVTYSPLGQSIYAAVTRGSKGAEIAPLAYPPPPDTNLRTGRD
jgi:hypothetical protein